MWNYTDKVMDHFMNPRNVGEIENPDGVGEVGNAACGDALKLTFKLDDQGRIADVKFRTFGCASAIASSSALTELIKGMTLDEAAKVSNPFSMDQLIYSVTLDQYMTHCGIDIEASADSQVVAVAEGTVTAIYNDDRYGLSVEITHPGHVITIYSNLADSSELVEVGDVVTAGEIIGGVGSTGLFESLEPAHLHFEMLIDGAYVDPADHITF